MAMDRSTVGVVIGLETHKLARGTVVRVATAAALVLVMATTVGGYAAAMHAGDTDLGRKAASMVTSPGWDGYTALGATSVSVTMEYGAGVHRRHRRRPVRDSVSLGHHRGGEDGGGSDLGDHPGSC